MNNRSTATEERTTRNSTRRRSLSSPPSRIPRPQGSRQPTRRAAASSRARFFEQLTGNEYVPAPSQEEAEESSSDMSSEAENAPPVDTQTNSPIPPPPPFPLFNNLAPRNDDQANIIEIFDSEVSETRTGSELTDWIALQLPPSNLFKSTVLTYTRLYTVIFQFYRTRNVNISSANRETLPVKVAKATYRGIDLDNCLSHLESSFSFESDSNAHTGQNSTRPHTADPQESTRKLVSALSQRFQQSRQFSGSENLHNTLTSYQYAAKDLHMTDDQKLCYFHHLFRDDALVFYQNYVEGKCTSFNEAVKRIEDEFNPLSRQIQVYRSLRSLSFQTFADKTSSLTEALDKLNSFILNKANQVPAHHRNEETKTEFLRDAITGCSWSREVLIQTANTPLPYQQLLARLHGAITEEKASTNKSSNLFPTHYTTGQKMYGRNSRPNQQYRQARPYSSQQRPFQQRYRNPSRPHQNSDISCWNCGIPGHRLSDCRKPHNVSQITARKLAHYNARYPNQQNKVVRRVLYELASQMDTPDDTQDAFPDPSEENHIEQDSNPMEEYEEDPFNQDVGPFPLEDDGPVLETLLTSSDNHDANAKLYDDLQDF